MEKKREVFLFGAGAIIDWGAPTTNELTELILNSGFTIKDSDTTITKFLYQRLIEYGYKKDEVNFETIISVIEELIVYYSEIQYFENNNWVIRTTYLLRPFVNNDNIDVIFNYSIVGGERRSHYKLNIPIDKEYPYAKPAKKNENPNQFFLQHLLSRLLETIYRRISKYSYTIDKESNNSILFRKWIKRLSENKAIRLYTLNYDNVFSALLKEENIDCFEGFFNEKDEYSYGYRADVLRILSDSNSNIHFNLHGSAYWTVLAENEKGLFIPEIVLSNSIHLPTNDIQSTTQIEKGRNIIISNIITGYQKAQKSVITPFRQMMSAFDKDIYSADKLTIIGYSFGDEHINETIHMALRYNDKLKIEIVDSSFIDNIMDSKLSLSLFPFLKSNNLNPKQLIKNQFSYHNGIIKAYNMKFSDYLIEMNK